MHIYPELMIVVPTLNAAADWPAFTQALTACIAPGQVLVVDSASTDGTAELARAAGFRLHSIARTEFSHGGTRQLAAELLPEAKILLYMTQDAVLAGPDSLELLIASFDDPTVAMAVGRQLPRPQAGPLEAHARVFNYPAQSSVRTPESRKTMGFKSIFASNSFTAYRRSALISMGGFPTNAILGEDTIVAARFLLAGWKIAYVAESCVYHSHDYTTVQEFKRYFDTGVLHAREAWLRREFGSTGGEGLRFIRSELASLWPIHASLLPSAVVRTASKFLGYRLGRMEQHLPLGWKRRLSMSPWFWKDGTTVAVQTAPSPGTTAPPAQESKSEISG